MCSRPKSNSLSAWTSRIKKSVPLLGLVACQSSAASHELMLFLKPSAPMTPPTSDTSAHRNTPSSQSKDEAGIASRCQPPQRSDTAYVTSLPYVYVDVACAISGM